MTSRVPSWKPEPVIINLIRGASLIRAAGAVLFIVAGLAYVWLAAVDHGSGTLTVLLQVPLISMLAGYRSRVPGRAREADYDKSTLRNQAHMMQSPVPEIRVVPRKGASVRLRGRSDHPTIVLSPLSLLTWKRDEVAHVVQVTHELGHVWAKDLGRFYFLSTGVLVVAVEVAIVATIVNPSDLVLLLLTVGAGLVSLRSFLRFREHAADYMAGTVLGEQVRGALPDSNLDEGRLPMLLRAHPSPAQRRRVFLEPEFLYVGIRVPMFALGFTAIFAARTVVGVWHLAAPGAGPLAVHLALLAVGLYIGWTVGRLMMTGGFMAPDGAKTSWFGWLFLGTVTCYFLVTPAKFWSIEFAVTVAIALLASDKMPLLADLAVIAASDPSEAQPRASDLLVNALTPFIAWTALVEFSYLGVYDRFVHLLQSWL